MGLLQADGLSNLGSAIQMAFDLINCERWENGESYFMTHNNESINVIEIKSFFQIWIQLVAEDYRG